jgi:hypothetical protein
MKLPMAGELNSTFNSLESHLLTADENINGYNIRGAISELNLANDQLYAHQLAMLDVVYPFFGNRMLGNQSKGIPNGIRLSTGITISV